MLSPAKALADELSKNRSVLISEILTQPDFSEFWVQTRKYSLHNSALLYSQMKRRRIPLSPVNSFQAWKDSGISVAPGQQAIYVMAPKEIDDEIYFNLTPVFALSQTKNPVLPTAELPVVDSIEQKFSYVYSLIPQEEDLNPTERIITALLVIAAFDGPDLLRSVTLRPYLETALNALPGLRREAKVFQVAQKILRQLFVN